LGDAVMFVSSDPDAAVAAATAVVEGAAGNPDLPEARAGLDFGEVRALGGDYFGRTINVAARLTGFARPGTVVASEELIGALQREVASTTIGRTRLKGVGTVRAYKIRTPTRPQDGAGGVGSRRVSADDETEADTIEESGGTGMASKDKGGKSEKKEPKKSLKEKRATKKEKKK
ncbi:MAG: hypothetical protein M3345_00905, partial [Actinomycetota bacterium]|nr:hypothetical protein [Actinomycetota bacterium]